ncbi:hypothetical protein ACWGH5_35120 [Streptomyces sp. NPDC054864]
MSSTVGELLARLPAAADEEQRRGWAVACARALGLLSGVARDVIEAGLTPVTGPARPQTGKADSE